MLGLMVKDTVNLVGLAALREQIGVSSRVG
jgi:hypothetical protein